jgi:hypothetical protein
MVGRRKEHIASRGKQKQIIYVGDAQVLINKLILITFQVSD